MKKTGLFMLLAVLASSSQAATFGVKVVADNGQPIVGAAVCIGTHGNYRQFAAQFTSSTGDVSVEVPNVPLVVTVSKDRFSGMRIAEPARTFNLIKKIKLIEGVPGPRCRAGSSMAINSSAPDPRSLVVNRVQIKTSAESGASSFLSLVPDVTGEPSHYRISDSFDITQAHWHRFTPAIRLPEKLRDKESIYMQVRRFKSRSTGWIEARSLVVSVPLPRT